MHKKFYYSGTSLIRTSLNRNLANPNGKARVNFFFFAILTYFFLYSDGACPSSTPSLAADSTFLTCMNKDVSIHAKLLTSFTHHLASNPWPNLKYGSGTMKRNCRWNWMTEGKWYPIFIYSEKNKGAHNTIMHSKQIVITVALPIANVCEFNYIHSNCNDIHYCTNQKISLIWMGGGPMLFGLVRFHRI